MREGLGNICNYPKKFFSLQKEMKSILIMKKSIFIILVISALVCMNSLTVIANDRNQFPQIVLTLNDSNVISGYLRSDIHDAGSKVSVSETPKGKKMSYKIADISSLKVTYADGQEETYVPIYVWDKNFDKNPFLATVCFSGNHVTGYRMPGQYVRTSAAVPSSNFQSYSWKYDSWIFFYQVDNSDKIKYFWLYIPVKKAPKLKSIIKNVKKEFKDYPIVAETIESEGLNADEIVQDPCILLEILDKSL